MKEWVRRNWLDGLAVMFLSLSMVGVYLNIMDARTAHAQKPSPCPAGSICTAVAASDVRVDLGEIKTRGLVEFYDNGAFSRWIEQHCVAVMAQTDQELMHKPGRELKLRCTPDKEGGK